MVTLVPDTVQTLGVTLEKVTVNPDVAVAEIVNGVGLMGRLAGAEKLID
jgi:hypothetical protein